MKRKYYPTKPCERSGSLRERGATTVEYVGLAAVSTMLTTGIASVFDSVSGERIGTALVAKIVAIITGS